MFMLLFLVCTPLRLGTVANIPYVHVYFVVEGMYTCKTEYFDSLRFFCDIVQGMYTFKTGHFGDEPEWLCFCCCRGYVHK